MSWFDGVAQKVLREDLTPHCDHGGVIFCTWCKEENCADRMARLSSWREAVVKSKSSEDKLRRRRK